jgi:curved DNA-binding protein
MEFKDYYKILGVDSTAEARDIKVAYRKLARKYHPDVSEHKDAEARFKEVAEAYEVLKDPSRRAEYDELRQYGGPGQDFEPPPGWTSYATSGDHAGAGFGSGFSDFFSSIFGGEPGTHGFRAETAGDFGGRGQDIEVDLPMFLEERERIRLKGQGSPGLGDGTAGDLYLHIRLVPHPLFDVEGHNLLVMVPVAPWEAALGTKIEVPTLTGKINLTIPANSQNGQRLRVRNKGLVTRQGRGDLYAVIKVAMPDRCDDATIRLWGELAQAADFDPRMNWRG